MVITFVMAKSHAIVGGVEYEIELVGHLHQFAVISGIQHAMGSEREDLFAFRCAGGEGGDLAAPCTEKLDRKMTEPADADDGNAIGWADATLHDRVENGDPATEERPSLAGIECIGQRADPRPVGANTGREAAVPLDDGAFRGGAEIRVARQAGRAAAASCMDST